MQRDSEEALGQGVGLMMTGQGGSHTYPYGWWDTEEMLWAPPPSRQFRSSENRPQDRVKCKKFNTENTCERHWGARPERDWERTTQQWARSDPKWRREKAGVLGGSTLDCSAASREVCEVTEPSLSQSHHQKSVTYPRQMPVQKSLLCSVSGQLVGSEAWGWRAMDLRV